MQGVSYLTGKHCCVLIISAEKARKHGIDTQADVLIEENENGFSVVNRIAEGSSDPQTDTDTELDTNSLGKSDIYVTYRPTKR